MDDVKLMAVEGILDRVLITLEEITDDVENALSLIEKYRDRSLTGGV